MGWFDNIIGNKNTVSILENEIEKGSLSHAYIFEGAIGSGRKTLAKSICCALSDGYLAEKIMSENEPDIIYVTVPKDKAQIPVSAVREIREESVLAPNELSFKAFIICEAQKMNENAQNALLKILEEPPENTYFFLISSGAGLLTTVKSRAPTIKMQVFGEDELDLYVCENSKKAKLLKANKPDEYAFLLKNCCGAIGAAAEGIAGGMKDYNLVIGFIDALCAGDKGEFLLYDTRLPDDREKYTAFLKNTTKAFRDIYAKKHGVKSDSMFFTDDSKETEYAFTLSDERLLGFIGILLSATEETEYNLNIKTARMNTLARLWSNE